MKIRLFKVISPYNLASDDKDLEMKVFIDCTAYSGIIKPLLALGNLTLDPIPLSTNRPVM